MTTKYAFIVSMAAALATFASPASAAVQVCSSTLTNLPTPNAASCVYDQGSLIGGNRPKIQAQQAAISALPGSFEWDGVWQDVSTVGTLTDTNRIDFGTTLYGLTVVSAHFGNVAGPQKNVTVFWQFDFGTAGANYITLDDKRGFDSAALYTTGAPPAVPEPSTWLLAVLGFGAIGYSLRRKAATAADLKTA